MRRLVTRTGVVLAGLLLAVSVATLFVATTEAGARWMLARVSAASGARLRWSAVDGTLLRGLRLDDMQYDDGSMLLGARRVEFTWQPWRLFDGSLVLDRVELTEVRYAARSAGAPLTEEAWRAALRALPLGVELREFHVGGIEVHTDDGSSFVLDSVSGAAALADGALAVSRLEVRQGENILNGDLQLAPELTLAGTFSWQARIDTQSYAGILVAGGSLHRIELTHTLLQPLQVVSRGNIVPGLFAGEEAGFELQHDMPAQALAAFGQQQLQVQGSVRTAGTAQQIGIGGAMHAVTGNFAPLDLAFALTYQDGALNIDSATLASSQIGLGGSGRVQLDPLALRFDWTLERLDAGAQWPQVRLENVTGSGNVQLSSADGEISGALQLVALTGSLNGHPLAMAGTVNVTDSGISSVELRAASGANTLVLSGATGTALDLRWDLQAPALGALWQGLAGNLRGSGSIGGTIAAPQVNGTLNGEGMRLARAQDVLALAAVSLSAAYGADGNALELQLGALTRRDDSGESVLLQQGQLALSGTPDSHTLRGAFAAPDSALEFSLTGAVAGRDWRGTLHSAALNGRYGDWQLQGPAALQYAAGALSIAEHCWAYLETRLCARGGKPALQGFDVDLALTALPLTWLNPAPTAPATKPPALQDLQDAFALNLPEGVRTEGAVDLQLAVRDLRGAQWNSLDLVLQPRAVVVQLTQQLASDEQTLAPLVQRFELDVNRGELHYADAAWSGEVDLQVARAEASGSVAQGSLRGNATLGDDGAVAGTATFDFTNLAWIESVLPNLRAPSGSLGGTLGIGGSRAQPQLTGRMQLRNGGFELPAYGLVIRNVNLGLADGADGALQLTGTAQSGEGTLTLQARIRDPLQAQRAVTAELGGTDFLAFATDYARASISPRLHAEYSAGGVSLSGEVDVTDTDIDLEAVFGADRNSAVVLSRDVVIVRGQAQADTGSLPGSMPVSADLVLRLGDQVHVYGYDLDAYLKGELALAQTPGRPLLVYGELDIPQGHYEIYNQQLSARDGRLVFFGNPANPVLDVRAFRATATAEVGVVLSGNLNDIQGRLYSTPTLPDNEILALLVTGKSFGSINTEENAALLGAIASFGLGRGQGLTERVGSTLGLDSLTVGGGTSLQDSALGLGKYLTPDLLMRYKVGLFDRQSVLGIEYKLNEHVKLEVETGISQSVDLSYTIEKD